MRKIDMANHIATAVYPEHFRVDSPAVQGHVAELMKNRKPVLEDLMSLANKVHAQRKGETK